MKKWVPEIKNWKIQHASFSLTRIKKEFSIIDENSPKEER